MNKFSIEEVQQIIDELQGTPDSIDTVVESLFNKTEEDLNMSDFAFIDQQIFLCDICGWWYEQGEMANNENWECQDCEL